MRTKHFIIILAAFLAVFMSSCSEEQAEREVKGMRTFTFNLTTDGQAHTRAAAPDVTDYKLEYFLQVLGADGNAIDGYTESASNSTGQFEVALPVGAAYTCLFWADYVPSTGDAANEFFTATQLKAVTLKKNLTDESRCQAFCGKAEVANGETVTAHDITLKRAVAQVNIKTATQMIGYSKLTASYTGVPNTFHVADNTVATDAGGTVNTQPSFEVTDFPTDPDTDGALYTNQSAYVLASPDGTGSMLEITIETQDAATGGTTLQTLTVPNVPAKKNYKTNILVDFDPANLEHSYSFDFSEWNADESDYMPYSVWNGTYPAPNANALFSGGDGDSEATAYNIGNANDFAQFAVNVTSGTTDYDGKYFKLTNSIDLNHKEWTPIGVYINHRDAGNKAFKGNFDGTHKKIVNLKIDNNDLNSIGLFGYIVEGTGKSGIQNLHVSGTVKSGKADSNAGGIVGTISTSYDYSQQEIRACSFDEGSVTNAAGIAAGIASYTSGYTDIFGCINRGNISGKDAGGIVNWSQCGIAGCYNEGTITATERGAGIASNMMGDATDYIGYCYNIGTVTGATIAPIADDQGVTGCYSKELYSTTQAVKEFGADVWPSATDTDNNPWYVDANPDGTRKRNDATGKYEYKIWKSVGGWNGGVPTYPKLWWEE